MTFQDLIKLPRVGGTTDSPSLLGLWIKANKDGDTKMVDLTMSAMCHDNKVLDVDSKPPGQFPKPQTDKSIPKGYNAMLLRRIDRLDGKFDG